MEEMLIHMALSIILATIKNPAKKEKLKAAFLKVRDEINILYPGA
jgi:hypothetical protein